MAWGDEKGRSMNKASPRYATYDGDRYSSDDSGFDRVMKIFFLLAIPAIGLFFSSAGKMAGYEFTFNGPSLMKSNWISGVYRPYVTCNFAIV